MSVRAQLEEQLGPAYRIERELGGGGMSHVFLAEEVSLGRRVVVKVLPPEATGGIDAERFRREIQLAASLQHPHIVTLLSAGAADGLLWYSMPYVEGESLRGRLVRDHELPLDAAVRIWRELLDALSYAHGRGIVHRDIKPENILMSGRHAVVTDFGVAKALSMATGGGSMTSTGVSLGTPSYMAPEQATADPSLDHRADIYAAGLVMYEMLVGHGPFPGLAPSQMMAAHATRAPEPIATARPAVPAPLAALVMRCLEKRPADRPQSADEVLTALETIVTPNVTTPVASAPSAAVLLPAIGLSGGRNWRRFAVAAAVVIAAVAGGVAYASRGTRTPARVGADPTDTTVRAIGIVDFESAPADSVIARVATQAVRTKVAESSRLFTLTRANLISFYRWAFDLADNELPPADSAAAALTRSRMHAVVRGSVARLGAGYTLTADFVLGDPASPSMQAVTVSADDSTTLSTSVARLASEVVAALERSAPRMVRPRVGGLATTTSVEALRLFQEATMVAFGRRGDWGTAVALLRQAVRIDTTFSPGWRRIATNLSNSGIRPAESVRAAFRAYAGRGHVKSWERGLIEGTYLWSVDRHAEAAGALEDAARRGQNDAMHNRALSFAMLGDYAVAERLFAESVAGLRTFGNGHHVRVRNLLALGDVVRADSILAWGATVSPQGQLLAYARRYRAYATRDLASAVQQLRADPGADSAPPASSVRIARARGMRVAAAIAGQVRAADSVGSELVQSMMAFESPPDALRERLDGLALRAATGQNPAEVRRRLEDLLRETPFERMDPLDRPYKEVVSLRLATGDAAGASAAIEQWDRDRTGEFVSVDSIVRNVARAELALVAGRFDEALRRFRDGMKAECASCVLPGIARTFEAMNRPDSAIAQYEAYLRATNPLQFQTDARELARTYQRLGELYEAKGDTKRAIQRYGDFVELWKNADPELQPKVTEVRDRIAKLQKRIG